MISSSWDGRPFGHNRHVPKMGLCPFGGGGAGSPSNTMWPGPRPTSVPSGTLIRPAVSPQDMRRKLGGAVLFGRGELGPHLTQCGLGWGLLPCQVSFWSIQPFSRNTPTLQTDRQDRTNRTGQWSDSKGWTICIGWTVLQMVHPKIRPNTKNSKNNLQLLNLLFSKICLKYFQKCIKNRGFPLQQSQKMLAHRN